LLQTRCQIVKLYHYPPPSRRCFLSADPSLKQQLLAGPSLSHLQLNVTLTGTGNQAGGGLLGTFQLGGGSLFTQNITPTEHDLVNQAITAGVTDLSGFQLNVTATGGNSVFSGNIGANYQIPVAGDYELFMYRFVSHNPTQGTQTQTSSPAVTISPFTLTYGTALANSQLNATATWSGQPVAGTFSFSTAAGSVPAASAAPYNVAVTFTPTDTTHYAVVNTTVGVTVNPATPTANVNPVAITYGTALANPQLSGTASVAGAFAYTTGAGTVLTASTIAYPVSVTFTPGDATDFNPVTATVMVTVGKATPTVLAASASTTYTAAASRSPAP
jgi:hypothetical protein